MRVIAGEYRGRTIEAPKGMDTRPTTDRVRESLMSSVKSAIGGYEGIRVCDAFAGSGALGIEALSRGAAFALFTDKDRRVCDNIRANLERFGVAKGRYRVLCTDVLSRGVPAIGAFDLVFLDPPYAYPADSSIRLLEGMERSGLLAEDVLITYEHAKGSDVSALTASIALPLEIVSSKLYGNISIEFARKVSQA